MSDTVGSGKKFLGSGLIVNEDYASVCGSGCIVRGNYCKVCGSGCIIHGHHCQVVGTGAIVYGDNCKVVGTGCKVYGKNCEYTGNPTNNRGGTLTIDDRGNIVVRNMSIGQGSIINNAFDEDGNMVTQIRRSPSAGRSVIEDMMPVVNMANATIKNFTMEGNGGTGFDSKFHRRVCKLVGRMPVDVMFTRRGFGRMTMSATPISNVAFDESSEMEVKNPMNGKLKLIADHGKITLFDLNGLPMAEPPKRKKPNSTPTSAKNQTNSATYTSSSSTPTLPAKKLVEMTKINTGGKKDIDCENEDDPTACHICQERKMLLAAMPCGHLYICIECATKSIEQAQKDKKERVDCAKCNTPVDNFNVVYL